MWKKLQEVTYDVRENLFFFLFGLEMSHPRDGKLPMAYYEQDANEFRIF